MIFGRVWLHIFPWAVKFSGQVSIGNLVLDMLDGTILTRWYYIVSRFLSILGLSYIYKIRPRMKYWSSGSIYRYINTIRSLSISETFFKMFDIFSHFFGIIFCLSELIFVHGWFPWFMFCELLSNISSLYYVVCRDMAIYHISMF